MAGEEKKEGEKRGEGGFGIQSPLSFFMFLPPMVIIGPPTLFPDRWGGGSVKRFFLRKKKKKKKKKRGGEREEVTFGIANEFVCPSNRLQSL